MLVWKTLSTNQFLTITWPHQNTHLSLILSEVFNQWALHYQSRGLDESKKEEKSLTKEVKGGKTMTGKKVNEIDVNPKIEGDKEK